MNILTISITFTHTGLRHLCALISTCTILLLTPQVMAATSIMGTLEGQASVNQGRLDYRLGLDLPAGINNHTPALSLHYNPGGGNGALGVGFNLNGPSVIARCSANKRVDGARGAVLANSEDNFCLDGQRLIPVQGDKGGDGTGYVTSLNQHSRITSTGQHQSGPAAWLVERPNGERWEFAHDPHSVDQLANNGVIMRWRLSTRTDANGNSIQYRYKKVQGRSQLTQISYAHHQVDFVYEARPDTLSMYQHGVAMPLTQRLSYVQVKTNNQPAYSYRVQYDNSLGLSRLAQVRRCEAATQSLCQAPTTFGWQADEALPSESDLPEELQGTLAEINNLSTDSNLIVRDQIDFSDVPRGFLTYKVVDLNRDGIRDLCYLDKQGLHCGLGSQGQTPTRFSLWSDELAAKKWQKWGAFQTLALLDLNGDRFPDYCIRDNQALNCALNNQGTGFASASIWLRGAHPQGQHLDVNNDQQADWCSFEKKGVTCRLSNGKAFVGQKRLSDVNYQVKPKGDGSIATARFMDISGDGLPDLCGFFDAGLRCQRNLGSDKQGLWQLEVAKNHAPALTQSFMQQEGIADTLRMGDLNGDRLMDICVRDKRQIRCAINDGQRLTDLQNWLTLPNTYKVADWNINHSKATSPHDGTLSLIDWNQDGKADLCVAQRGQQYQCALNNTTAAQQGFAELLKVADLIASPYQLKVRAVERGHGSGFFDLFQGRIVKDTGQVEPMRHYPLQWADINSDGAMDFCHRSAKGITCSLGQNVRYHRLTGITSGMGKQTRIDYGRLNQTSVFKSIATSDSSLVPYVPAMTVVTRLSQSNPVGGFNHTDYQYAGVYYDLTQTRRTPFAKVTAHESAFDRQQVHHYHVAGPLSGRVQQQQTLHHGQVTSQQTYQHKAIIEQPQPLIKRVRLQQQQSQRFDLGGQHLGTTTTSNQGFDQYDRVTQRQVSTNGNVSHTQTTKTQYQHHTNNRWLLGLPTQVITHVTGQSQPRVQAYTYDSKGNRLTHTQQPGHAPANTTTYTYDSHGNVTAQTAQVSGQQRSQSWTYASNGIDMLSHTNPLGHKQSWQYDATCGQPTRHTDANGLVTTWAYDSLCRQTSEQQPQGSQLTWRYAFGKGGSVLGGSDQSVYHITQTQTDHPDTTSYHDLFGQVVRTKTRGFDNKTVYQDNQYDARGLKVKTTVPYFEGQYAGANARWTAFEYDALLRPSKTQRPGPNNSTETTQTNYAGWQHTHTDARGVKRRTTYNALGQIIRVTEGNGQSTLTYQYDGWGQLTQSNANGTVISHQYDILGNKTRTQDPSLGTWHFTYNGFGDQVQQKDAKGQITRFTYDALGRPIKRIDNSGTSVWTYDDGNKAKGKLSSSAASGAMGSSQTQISYNSKGLPNKVTETIAGESFNTSTDYDAIGRPKTLNLPDGIVYHNRYANGQLSSIEVPKQQIWDYNFLAIEKGLEQAAYNIKRLGDLIKKDEAEEIRLANEARRLFDVANNWAKKGQQLQAQANQLYHYAKRLQSTADYYQRVVSRYRNTSNYLMRQYGNAYFRLVSKNGYYRFRYSKKLGCARRNRSGRCKKYAYQHNHFTVDNYWINVLGYRNSRGIRPHEFYSRLANHYKEAGDSYQDYAGRYEQSAESKQDQANAANKEASYYQELAQQRIKQAKELTAELAEYRQKLTTEQTRQAKLQAQWEAHQNNSDSITVWSAVNRDAAGRLTAQLHGNGLVTHQQHDPFTGRLHSIKTGSNLSDDSTLVRHLSYTYDANNNVTQRQDHINGLTESYQYDPMERLTQVQANQGAANKAYAYDSRGNMVSKSDAGSMMYDSRNRLTKLTGNNGQQTQYQYDANGNQTRGLGHTLSWNAFNKLSQLSQNGHSSQFQYGADRKRTQQTETRRDGSRRTTQYVSTHYERMVEQTADGQRRVQGTHTFFAEGQAVVIHVRTTVDGEKDADQFRYLHRDPLNSVDTITDANAQVQERLSYGPFGQRRHANGQPLADLTRNPSTLTTRGYTNHEHLDQVQLINMNARMYDPVTARFLSADTMIPWPTMAMSHNRYTYVMNNPLKYHDPTGHSEEEAAGGNDDSGESWLGKIWNGVKKLFVGGSGGNSGGNSSGDVGVGTTDTSGTPQDGQDNKFNFGWDGEQKGLGLGWNAAAQAQSRRWWKPGKANSATDVVLRTGQVIGGAAQVFLGGGMCYTSFGWLCVPGAGIAAKGADNMQSGYRGTDSYSQRVIEWLVKDKNTAILINAGLDLSTSAYGLGRGIPAMTELGTKVRPLMGQKVVPGDRVRAWRQTSKVGLHIEALTAISTTVHVMNNLEPTSVEGN